MTTPARTLPCLSTPARRDSKQRQLSSRWLAGDGLSVTLGLVCISWPVLMDLPPLPFLSYIL